MKTRHGLDREAFWDVDTLNLISHACNLTYTGSVYGKKFIFKLFMQELILMVTLITNSKAP